MGLRPLIISLDHGFMVLKHVQHSVGLRNTLSVHGGLGWTQQFSSRELFLVCTNTGRGYVFGAVQAKSLQHSIKILWIAFNGHRSIESVAKTFQVIILRAFVMNAAITEPNVGRKDFGLRLSS